MGQAAAASISGADVFARMGEAAAAAHAGGASEFSQIGATAYWENLTPEERSVESTEKQCNG